MTAARAFVSAAAILAIVVIVQACASSPPEPRPRLADLVREDSREMTPYQPFTASEMGLRQYDRVLANNIGEEYRTGLAGLCSRYRADLRRVDTGTLTEHERVTRDIFEYNLDTCLQR